MRFITKKDFFLRQYVTLKKFVQVLTSARKTYILELQRE